MVRKKKRSGGVGIIALFIAGVVAAGYYFRDCIPSFGLGKGGGGGSEESSAKESAPETAAKNTVAIVIKGEQCSLPDGAPGDCVKACESLKSNTPVETRIEIEATHGTQQTVDAFKKCLEDAGFRTVLAQTK